MKIEYDNEADAAYIYFEFPVEAGAATKTVEVNEHINFDYNDAGKLLGIEILQASTVLPKESIVQKH